VTEWQPLKVQLHGFSQEFSIDNVKFTLVPEPATWVLALVALGGLLIVRRRGVPSDA